MSPHEATILFFLATLAGASFATMTIEHDAVPLPLAILHATPAATLIVVGIWVLAVNEPPWTVVVALGLFAAAAIGEAPILAYRFRHMPVPRPLAYLDAGALAMAYGCLFATVAIA